LTNSNAIIGFKRNFGFTSESSLLRLRRNGMSPLTQEIIESFD
jgi:hypothetical protein